MPPGTTNEQFQLMLRDLQAERFHLVLHHETKEFPGYELVLASGGTRLKEAAPEDSTRATAAKGSDANGFPVRRAGDRTAMQRPR
jgi:uncharacterized protein (TIGR03435 family)